MRAYISLPCVPHARSLRGAIVSTMRSEKQISMVALMWLVVVTALQFALFQDFWFIVLFPPVSIAVLALNLGFLLSCST
jgi:hypothetical protein